MILTATQSVTVLNLTATHSGTSVALQPVINVGGTGSSGTVTSVAATVPTGLVVTGSPITSSGTLAIAYDTGYEGFTTAEASAITANTAKVSFPEAPNDGTQYARKNLGWEAVASSGGGFQQIWEWRGVISAFNNGTKYYYGFNATRGSGRNADITDSFIASNESLMAADYQTGSWGQVLYDQTIVKFYFMLGKIAGTSPSTFDLKMFKCTYDGVTQLTRVKIADVRIGTLMKDRELAEVLAVSFSNTTLTKGDWLYFYIATDTLNTSNLSDSGFYLETTAS